jgi:ribulose-5-phosphate 4-epimerase/fuculose-1-phosphate aldolase
MAETARDHARQAVIRCARRMVAERLVSATAGNLSVRVAGEPELIAMTPTGIPYDELERDDVCLVSTAGERVDGRREPTSELPLHTLLYAARPEIGAIVHTHSSAAMTMAVLGRPLPPILTGLVEATGGDVRVTPYAPPGSAALAEAVEDALTDRGACFLRHHGLVAIGADLARAFRAASVTEVSARVYLDACAQGGVVPELPAADVAEIARAWRAQWVPAVA